MSWGLTMMFWNSFQMLLIRIGGLKVDGLSFGKHGCAATCSICHGLAIGKRVLCIGLLMSSLADRSTLRFAKRVQTGSSFGTGLYGSLAW
jgi:hypothetical protein